MLFVHFWSLAACMKKLKYFRDIIYYFLNYMYLLYKLIIFFHITLKCRFLLKFPNCILLYLRTNRGSKYRMLNQLAINMKSMHIHSVRKMIIWVYQPIQKIKSPSDKTDIVLNIHVAVHVAESIYVLNLKIFTKINSMKFTTFVHFIQRTPPTPPPLSIR